MKKQERDRPFSLSDADITRVRSVLDAASFDERTVAETCGVKVISALKDMPAGLALERASTDSPLHVFIRLFVIGVPCRNDAVKRAVAPMQVDTWVKGGLLAPQGGSSIARVKFVPIDALITAFDRSSDGPVSELQDHVMGPSNSASRLASLTIRRPCEDSLDMGAGCGFLAFLLSRHSTRVVASDINARAAAFTTFNAKLNRLSNVESLVGDRFTTVTGRQFDLVISNPPFLISPEDRLTYLNGGMKADAFCQSMAADAPRFLRDGGYFQMVCNWVELDGVDWSSRLASWFQGTGCDAWVLRSSTTDPVTYAKSWMNVGNDRDSSPDPTRLAAWQRYYEEENIASIGAGLVTMRKRTGTNWFRAFDGPQQFGGLVGEEIVERLSVLDFLAARDDAALMDSVLTISPEVRLVQECAPEAEGWTQVAAHVRVANALAYTEEVDAYVAELLVGCDGKRTLRAAVERAAARLSWDAANVPEETPDLVRQLLEEGFLRPTQS